MIEIFRIANYVFYALLGLSVLLLIPKIVFHFMGMGKAKKFPKAQKDHRYAILIAARNESKVIGQLLDCIKNQDYNQDLLHTFVIVESLDDPTCEICKKYKNVEVFLRQHLERKGKGYALDECFSKILAENTKEDEKYEAFFIIDADNILKKNFITEMNKCFDAGYQVACGYRNNKDWNGTWVSNCSGLLFTDFSTFKAKGKAKVGLNVQATGTGFYVSREMIENFQGWKFNTLTEDFEFYLYTVLTNCRSTYNHDAIFYDEQPTKLKVSWRQRLRWCKGFFQAGKIYNKQMLKSAFKRNHNGIKRDYDNFENATSVVPLAVSIITVLGYGLFNLVLGIVGACMKDPLWYWPIIACAGTAVGFYVLMVLYTAFMFIVDRDRIDIKPHKALIACLTNPFFMCLYIPIVIQALFTKDVQWKPIEHTILVSEDQIKQ